MGLITCATEDFYPVNWHRCGQSSKFLQTKPWVVQIFRMFSLGSVFCSLKMTVFSIEHGIFVQRFPHWPFFPSKSRSTSSRQWTKLNRLWWCPTLGDLRTFTLKSWDFNGISMDFIVLECWKFPCYVLAILMGNHFFAVNFFGLRFCAGHQQIVSGRLRMYTYVAKPLQSKPVLGMVFIPCKLKIAARLNRLSGVWFIELPTAFAYICRLGMFNHQMIGVDDYWWIPSPWKCLKKRCVVLGHATRM